MIIEKKTNYYSHLEELLLFRPLSRFIAQILTKTSIHPNHVSIVGFFFTFISATIMILTYNPDNLTSRIVISAILYLTFLLDKVDGDLARFKEIASKKGAYLDSFLDRFEEVIMLVAVAISTQFSNIFILTTAIAGPLLFYAHMYMFWYYSAGETSFFPISSLKRRYIRNLLAYTRSKHFLILITFCSIGYLEYSLHIFSLLIPYTIVIFGRLMLCDNRLQGKN